MAHERSGMTQPLLGSFLLHGGLAAAVLISWPWLNRPVRMEASVPVTLVAQAPVSNLRPAIQAPEETQALTEEPVPEATPEPAAPAAPPAAPAPAAAARPEGVVRTQRHQMRSASRRWMAVDRSSAKPSSRAANLPASVENLL